MTKYQKKQIAELANTLKEACIELKKLPEDKITNACADIQEFIAGIYGFVEGISEDQCTEILERFKEMYETLYKFSKGSASVKDIFELSKKIKSRAASLKITAIDIVFFCYKASMADCFESVYSAAKKDNRCNVNFVPIPYYDRNPDGSFGEMHLEAEGYYGEQFELTDWKEYNVEERRPDVIFIMNPYDEFNFVTSVHPDYYSSRLKKMTNTLIYIEYGLPLWTYSDCDKEREAIKKNVGILPVYIHCDYYIAYSKEIAQLLETAMQCHPEYAANEKKKKAVSRKCIPLGSPKFDKVLTDKKENYILPYEWQKKISGKKVVLYNTSLGELLKSTVKQLEAEGNYNASDCKYFLKLRSVLNSFKDNNSVVIWWRPHPLFESTLSSMRPGLLDEYNRIKNEFINMGQGIFDISSELHRAIVFSDALISDESSVLYLYLATGKPFYIPSISKALRKPVHNTENDYHAPLKARLSNMRAHKGANVRNLNTCIWWDNFLEDDFIRNTRFGNYVNRFLDFVQYPEKYPEAEEYKALQLKIFEDFVVNPDSTAGEKILEFAKNQICPG